MFERMKFRHPLAAFLVWISVFLLTACSGGGGGGDHSSPTPPGGGTTEPNPPEPTPPVIGWSAPKVIYELDNGSVSSVNLVALDETSTWATWLESSGGKGRVMAGKLGSDTVLTELVALRDGIVPVERDWNYSWTNYNTVVSSVAPGTGRTVTAWIEQSPDHVYEIWYSLGSGQNSVAGGVAKRLHAQSGPLIGFNAIHASATGSHVYVLYFTLENGGELRLSDIDTSADNIAHYLVSATASTPQPAGAFSLQPIFVSLAGEQGIVWSEDVAGSYQLTFATVRDIAAGKPPTTVATSLAKFGELSAATSADGRTTVFFVQSSNSGPNLSQTDFDPATGAWSPLQQVATNGIGSIYSASAVYIGNRLTLFVGVSDSDATMPQRELRKLIDEGSGFIPDPDFLLQASGVSPIAVVDDNGNSLYVTFGNTTSAISTAADGETYLQSLGGNFATIKSHAAVISGDGKGYVVGAQASTPGSEIVGSVSHF